jgi:hypothetical protein
VSCHYEDPNADLTAQEIHSTGPFQEETTYEQQKTHYNYNGKFVLRRERSYIVHAYWKDSLIRYNPDVQAFFRHFYELWKGLENLTSADVTQRTIYADFSSFCRGEGIEQEFQAFWSNIH